MKQELTFFTLIIFLGMLCFSLGFVSSSKNSITDLKENILLKTSELKENCSSTDLFLSAKCLEKEIDKFYKYNISNTGKNLSFEQLKIQGGVCQHYAELFSSWAKQLGFYSDTNTIEVYMNKSGYMIMHEYATISNYQGYCFFSNDKLFYCEHLDINKNEVKNETI